MKTISVKRVADEDVDLLITQISLQQNKNELDTAE